LTAGVLLDTHALLWLIDGDSRVPGWLQEPAPATAIRISHASLWEIAIKRSLGRLEVDDDLPDLLDGLGVNWLAISGEHVWGVRELPHHHGDPFDRLLIAQALAEGLVVATADPSFAQYGIPVRW